MKLVKALGGLALAGMALGTAQFAAAESTTPIQELVIVEETTNSASPDARIPPDEPPYHGYFRPYGHFRPYGYFRPFSPFSPFSPFQPYRPYGHFRPFRPFRPYATFRPHGRPDELGLTEGAQAGDHPGPVVNLGEAR